MRGGFPYRENCDSIPMKLIGARERIAQRSAFFISGGRPSRDSWYLWSARAKLRQFARFVGSFKLELVYRTSPQRSRTSQAENTSSSLVARSRLDFVVTTDNAVASIAVGFRRCSPLLAPVRHFSLSQHCRNCWHWQETMESAVAPVLWRLLLGSGLFPIRFEVHLDRVRDR